MLEELASGVECQQYNTNAMEAAAEQPTTKNTSHINNKLNMSPKSLLVHSLPKAAEFADFRRAFVHSLLKIKDSATSSRLELG